MLSHKSSRGYLLSQKSLKFLTTGPTLQEHIMSCKPRLDCYNALKYTKQLLEVLSYLHVEGVLHCDIKGFYFYNRTHYPHPFLNQPVKHIIKFLLLFFVKRYNYNQTTNFQLIIYIFMTQKSCNEFVTSCLIEQWDHQTR